MPNPYDLRLIRQGLPDWRVYFVATCRSTSDLAARLRREGRLFAPAIVLTANQTAGRGRGANRWSSDPGTLTATFAIPIDAVSPPHELPLVAGLAVRDAIAGLLGHAASGQTGPGSVKLKWPNDILIDGKKVAGLLCERIDNVDLIGTGINVTTRLKGLPAAVQSRATSLELAGCIRSLNDTLLAVAAQVQRATQSREPFTAVLRRYDAHHHLVGRTVTVRFGEGQTVSGRCRGLDAVGRLLVEPSATAGSAASGGGGGVHRLIAGQVISY